MDSSRKTILVTGGAGFIGSALVRNLVSQNNHRIVNLDKLTYAGRRESLRDVDGAENYQFHLGDICDTRRVFSILRQERVDAILHLAAESHVDRSIDQPMAFVTTNVVGTVSVLSAAHEYWRTMDASRREKFRFCHVSTDEVFGDLDADADSFTETTAYNPSSPYSASKAASDHFVRAWHKTYGLPVLISNCSNNYGPYQFPEKLIPLVILNALEGKPLPIYGDGSNVRDWLFVDDHSRAIQTVMEFGVPGQTYAIGGRAERTNLQVVEAVCRELDECRPLEGGGRHRDLIAFVVDRPGHDRRYSIDPRKIEESLGWALSETFESGLAKTVRWYLSNDWWWAPMRKESRYGDQLGKLSRP